jgi:hypothetical protein
MRLMRYLFSTAVLITSISLHAQTKRALLIGINQYAPNGQVEAKIKINVPDASGPSRWDLLVWPNLDGSLNDVEMMRALLVSPKFAFPGDTQHMHVLTNTEATRQAILDAMQKYLVDEPAPGDVVVFYYAGHGSLRTNCKSTKDINTTKECPRDNTIVPADAFTGVFDVRDREIARIFNRALDKGVRLTAIFDSCHSGSIARGIPMGSPGKLRYLEYDPRDINEAADVLPNGDKVVAPQDRKNNPAIIFTGTQSDQLASEWKFNGRWNGAFTVALTEALRSLPAGTSANDVFKRVKVVMEGMGLNSQQPTIASSEARKREPLFGNAGAATRATVAVAPEGMLPDKSVFLDAGYVSGIGVGSTLVGVSDDNAAKRPRLEITEVTGMERSRARIIDDAGGIKIGAGDLFELEKWVPLEHSRLSIFVSPSLTREQLQAAVVQAMEVRSALGQSWVEDPLLAAPTHMVSWDGTSWVLSKSGIGKAELLGPTLKAKTLVAKVPPGPATHLFIDLPPTHELVAALKLDDPSLPVQLYKQRALAQYFLAGHIAGDQVEYSWVRKNYIEQGLTIRVTEGKVGTCSTDSSYPARSDWAKAPLEGTATTEAAVVRESLVGLARVRSWLELPVPPSGASSGFPYHLVLRNRKTSAVENTTALQGQEYDLVLAADGALPQKVKRKWVYVLNINCAGEGVLLYPSEAEGNQLPPEGVAPSEMSLTHNGEPVTIGEPFGQDTYILLTTSEQLPDRSVLKFQVVLRRSATAPISPLEELLSSTSSGTRSPARALPTDWSVSYVHLPSAKAAQGK